MYYEGRVCSTHICNIVHQEFSHIFEWGDKLLIIFIIKISIIIKYTFPVNQLYEYYYYSLADKHSLQSSIIEVMAATTFNTGHPPYRRQHGVHLFGFKPQNCFSVYEATMEVVVPSFMFFLRVTL